MHQRDYSEIELEVIDFEEETFAYSSPRQRNTFNDEVKLKKIPFESFIQISAMWQSAIVT